MAKVVATQELVFEAARSLAAEGLEPSMLTVQARIGGGSYTTIKRHLDAWKDQQAPAAQESIKAPDFVLEKSAELGGVLWAMAVREARKEALAAKELADGQVVAISGELTVAQAEIRRLEDVETDLSSKLEVSGAELQALVTKLQDAAAKALRLPELEARLAASQTELAAARQSATEYAVDVGRLTGESDALRAQVRDLTAALVSLKASPSAGDRT